MIIIIITTIKIALTKTLSISQNFCKRIEFLSSQNLCRTRYFIDTSSQSNISLVCYWEKKMFKLEGSVGEAAHHTLVFGEREKLEHR